MLRKKKNPSLPQSRIAEIWLTAKGNPVLRNLGKVDNDEMIKALSVLRDTIFSEAVIAKFLNEQNASIVNPHTGLPTSTERKN